MFFPFAFYRPRSRSVLLLLWGALTSLGPFLVLPLEEGMSVF